jgi:hypothetical protein
MYSSAGRGDIHSSEALAVEIKLSGKVYFNIYFNILIRFLANAANPNFCNDICNECPAVIIVIVI